MFYEFNKGSNAITAAKNVLQVYEEVISISHDERWINKFQGRNYGIEDGTRVEMPEVLGEDVWIVERYAQTLNSTHSYEYSFISFL